MCAPVSAASLPRLAFVPVAARNNTTATTLLQQTATRQYGTMARIRPVSHSRDAQSVLGSRISKQSTSRHKGSLRRLSRKPHPHALPTVITRAAGRALASSVLPENVEVQDNELPLSHSTTELVRLCLRYN